MTRPRRASDRSAVSPAAAATRAPRKDSHGAAGRRVWCIATATGQATSEYLLLLSILVVALGALMVFFLTPVAYAVSGLIGRIVLGLTG